MNATKQKLSLRMGADVYYFDRNDNTLHSAKFLTIYNFGTPNAMAYLLNDLNLNVAIPLHDIFLVKELCVLQTLRERIEYLGLLKISEKETIETIKALKAEKRKMIPYRLNKILLKHKELQEFFKK